METKFYVYKLISNNIPFYVGKGKKTKNYDRIEYHLKFWSHNKNRKLSNKIKKLNGVFDIEIIFESKDEQECLDLEQKIILEIGRKNLCNLTDGGEGVSGFSHSEETKQKISIWKKGKPLSEETCKKITQNKTGNHYKLKNIPEGKIEEMYKLKTIQDIANELNLAFTTIKNYLEEKNIYIPSKNRKPVNEETKIKKSKLMKGKNNKPVYQFNLDGKLINKFDSLTNACILNDIPLKYIGDIASSCRGKQKTARGYLWSYIETPPSPSYKNIRRNIIQYDLKGNFIKEHISASQAGREIKQNGNSISDCLNGKQKTAFGYIWKYKEN